MDEQPVPPGGVEDGVELSEVALVVAAWLRFDRLPEEVDAHRVQPGGGHAFDCTLEHVRLDPPGPVGTLDGHQMRPHGQDRPAIPLQVVGSPNDPPRLSHRCPPVPVVAV